MAPQNRKVIIQKTSFCYTCTNMCIHKCTYMCTQAITHIQGILGLELSMPKFICGFWITTENSMPCLSYTTATCKQAQVCTTTMINGAKWHNRAQLGLQSLFSLWKMVIISHKIELILDMFKFYQQGTVTGSSCEAVIMHLSNTC